MSDSEILALSDAARHHHLETGVQTRVLGNPEEENAEVNTGSDAQAALDSVSLAIGTR